VVVNVSTDPRAARSREAILAAARQLLLADGPAAVTHQRVAQASGVGRATVYRHWPRAEQLLLEVMTGTDMPFFRSPRSPVRPWLHEQLRRLADELRLPAVAAVALTVMHGSLWDPAIALSRDGMTAAIDERIEAALEMAARTGEVEPRGPATDTTALLVGPILYRTALQSGPVDDRLIDQLIDAVGTWRT
jgi:AcrR family transcriptional regulator